MAKKKNTPELRFKGFTEEWEEKELGEMANITTGKLDANAMKEDGQYDFYTSGIQKYRIDTAAFEGPAITIAGNGATVGYMHLADGKFNAYQRTYVLSEIKVNRGFLFSEIGIVLPIKVSQEARTGNIPYIVRDMLTDLMTFLPVKEEQSQIGSFFQNLDILIALHQRKQDKLRAVKKAMLEKMFPEEGADLPEIRFMGFTGKWERRTFDKNIISIKTGTNLLGSINDTGMPLIKMGNIQRGFFSFDKVEYIKPNSEIEKEDFVYFGDFLFNTRNTIDLVGKGATWLGESGKYIFNSNIARFVFRGIDTVFFNYLYNTKYLIKQVHARAMGTTSVAAIYPQSLNSIEYWLPHIDEQKQIGKFLVKLDSLISLQQRELDKLQHIKKACLGKMFA